MRFFCVILLLCTPLFAEDGSNELGKCPVFSANNIWNTPVDQLPVSAMSATYIGATGPTLPLHPDFGYDLTTGIPYNVIPNEKAAATVTNIHFDVRDQSDRMAYPIPVNAKVEGTEDHHLLIINKENCVLYEIFSFNPPATPGDPYTAYSGAAYNLTWDHLRPFDWTSADAAGLPIFPGLVRYEEVKAGEINHALRFTARPTQEAYVWPARHFASHDTNPVYMPMGTRVRLKSSVDISKYSKTNQVILKALKKYGMILADNGTPWFLSGTSDTRWNDGDLHVLSSLTGSDFEVVDVSGLAAAPDTAETIPGAAKLH